jgi:hypothetical protein
MCRPAVRWNWAMRQIGQTASFRALLRFDLEIVLTFF